MTAKIYHNARCGKSREAVTYLSEKGIPAEIIEYMKDPLTYDALDQLLQLLEMSPIDVIRTQEPEWKEHFAAHELEDEELIYAMIEYPKLMQRPIVVIGGKGLIARQVEVIATLL